MAGPSISVVLPAYNAERYLREALDSVFAQERCPFEVIVSDDASTDGTRGILATYGDRVKVVLSERNTGPGGCRNRAARVATGEYLAFLDADDAWTPKHLVEVAGLLDQWPRAAVAFCPVRLAGGREGFWPDRIPCAGEPRNIFLEMMRNNVVHPSSAIVRRSAFEEVGGFDEIVEFRGGRRVQAEDYDLVLRLSVDHDFVAAASASVFYRWHAAQSSADMAPQYLMAFKYRLRLLERLGTDSRFAERLPAAVDRVQMCWAEYIERLWVARDLPGLRIMVRYGLARPLLMSLTRPYCVKALLPAFAVCLRDVIAGNGNQGPS